MRRTWLAFMVMLAGVILGGAADAAPAMWRVADADSEIYLFGTMHVLSPEARWRTPAYDRAYERASTVWFEADLDSLDPAQMQALVARYGVDPARTLSQKLSPRELAALRPLLPGRKPDLARIDHLRPWAAALVLSTEPATGRGASVEAGADAVMTRATKADAKRFRAFETLEGQVRMFAGLPEPVELQYLTGVIRERTRPARNEPSLQAAWLAGDLARLGPGLAGAMKADSPAFYDAFLKQRNEAWAQALAGEMAGSGVELVNVGALHMVGEDGLPALMAARGFKVERIQ